MSEEKFYYIFFISKNMKVLLGGALTEIPKYTQKELEYCDRDYAPIKFDDASSYILNTTKFADRIDI